MSTSVASVGVKLCRDWFIEVSDDLCCEICAEVLSDPHQCTNGHMFCKVCIDEHLQKSKTCPTCRTKTNLGNMSKALYVKNIINNSKTRCANFVKEDKDNCSWTGPCSQREAHGSTECQFRKLKCSFGCNELVSLKNQLKHLQECSKRTVKCEHCKVDCIFDSLEDHKSSCVERPVSCKCGASLVQRELENHIFNTCPLTSVDCPLYLQQTCGKECKGLVCRKDVKSHVSSQVGSDVNIVFRLLEKIGRLEGERAMPSLKPALFGSIPRAPGLEIGSSSAKADADGWIDWTKPSRNRGPANVITLNDPHLVSLANIPINIGLPPTTPVAVSTSAPPLPTPVVEHKDFPKLSLDPPKVADPPAPKTWSNIIGKGVAGGGFTPVNTPAAASSSPLSFNPVIGSRPSATGSSPATSSGGLSWASAASNPVVKQHTMAFGVYEGEMAGAVAEGKGTMRYTSGVDKDRVYEGQFVFNMRHGYGKMSYPSGAVYVGEWQNNKKWGEGTITYPDGGGYKGSWRNDMKHGQGIKTNGDDGTQSGGTWKDDKRV